MHQFTYMKHYRRVAKLLSDGTAKSSTDPVFWSLLNDDDGLHFPINFNIVLATTPVSLRAQRRVYLSIESLLQP